MKKILLVVPLSLSLYLSLSFYRPARAQEGQPTPPAAATVPARTGTVTGQLANGTPGGSIPGNLAVTLHAWDAAGETLMLDGTVDEEGFFRFENVEMQDGWTFAAMLSYNGVTFFSDQAPVLPDLDEVSLPLTVYETTTDAAAVRVAQLHTFLEYAGGEVEVAEIYVLSNQGDRAVAGGVALPDGRLASLEFALPPGANKVTFEANGSQGRFSMIDASRFADTEPLVPGLGSSKVIVQYSLPYQAGMEIAHPVLYPLDGLNVIQRTDAGVTVAGPGLGEPVPQTMGDGGNYVVYTSGPLPARAGLALTLTGEPNYRAPEATATAAEAEPESWLTAELERLALPMGGGVFGLALIGLGAWWLRRTRRPATDAQPEEAAGGDTEAGDWTSALRQIALLDDAHERGEVPEAEYAERRAALKAFARARLAEEPGTKAPSGEGHTDERVPVV